MVTEGFISVRGDGHFFKSTRDMGTPHQYSLSSASSMEHSVTILWLYLPLQKEDQKMFKDRDL